MSKLVYLYGPITGLTIDGASDWRTWMRGQLGLHGIEAVSPLRGKENFAGLGELSAHGRDYPAGALATAPAILARDKFDVLRADMLVGNFLGARRVSIGSMFEQAWAHLHHKPVAVAAEAKGHVHDHLFFNQTIDFRCDSLEELRDVVLATLG